ncbi:MAG: hypothetical protein Q9204_000835 [Flavoplaca sp. TL-2023a]
MIKRKQSGDEDDSSIMSDESINDEEAEKAVEELLGKYTTLGSVAGGIAQKTAAASPNDRYQQSVFLRTF